MSRKRARTRRLILLVLLMTGCFGFACTDHTSRTKPESARSGRGPAADPLAAHARDGTTGRLEPGRSNQALEPNKVFQQITASNPHQPPPGEPAPAGSRYQDAFAHPDPPPPGERPPTNFAGVIPKDLPGFPGGINGTEFVPAPSFYGEETWDGLELRLLLYLVYQHIDLARLELHRNDPEGALRQYEKLLKQLRQYPIREAILTDIHQTLLTLAERSRIPLLAQLGRIDEAEVAMALQAWDPAPADQGWKALLTGMTSSLGGHDGAETDGSAKENFRKAHEAYSRLLETPPWTPAHPGPAATMASRHKDRLERVRTWMQWFNPVSTRQTWGAFQPEVVWARAWSRAIASLAWSSAAGAHPPRNAWDTGQRRQRTWLTEVESMISRVDAMPALSWSAPSERAEASTPLASLGTMDDQVRPTASVRPRTSPQHLQGMPTGDSYVDLLGQPGAPAVGTLEKLSLNDPEHLKWTEGFVSRINAALDRRDGRDVQTLANEMIATLERYPFSSRYFNIKQVRNETIRLLSLTGEYDAALSMLEGFYPLGSLDFRVPSRQGVLEGIKGRILLEAGRPDDAAEALELALEHTLRWLEYVDTYRETGGTQPK